MIYSIHIYVMQIPSREKAGAQKGIFVFLFSLTSYVKPASFNVGRNNSILLKKRKSLKESSKPEARRAGRAMVYLKINHAGRMAV